MGGDPKGGEPLTDGEYRRLVGDMGGDLRWLLRSAGLIVLSFPSSIIA